MKIKSLLLGSVAVLGLSSGAYAADPMVLALGLCDGFGVWNPQNPNYEGDTHCVRVTGGAEMEFKWGDYAGASNASGGAGIFNYNASTYDRMAPNGAAGTNLDWESKVEAWMRWVGIANASTGPVSAVIKFKEVQQYVTRNEAALAPGKTPAGGAAVAGTGGDHTFGVVLDEGYAQALIGESLWIAGGKKGTIRNVGDDTSFTIMKLFNSDKVDAGVGWSAATRANIGDGGHVVQASVDLGNGLVMKAGLEDLQTTGASGGDAYGVLEYTGTGFTGHATVAAGGILDGTVESFAAHLAGTATLDMVKLRGALAVDATGGTFSYNGLASAELMMNDITFAIGAEVAQFGGAAVEYGAGASASYAVSSTVTLQIGGRFYDPDSGIANDEIWHGLGKAIWKATDTLTFTAEAGASGGFGGATTVFYGKGELGFDAGGGFKASGAVEANSLGAYVATLKVSDDII